MNTKSMVLLDLFSGVGGFHKGLEQAGFQFDHVMYSEIDKYAISVYQNHFKDAEYVGSVIGLDATDMDVDIMTWGFPCQDASIAGKRKGFKGDRTSLFHEGIRVMRECRPGISIWENVAGLMSVNDGEDIQTVFDEMYHSGYVFNVSQLNTSWYLPQNRVRLYCVGYKIEDVLWDLSKTSGQGRRLNTSRGILEGYLHTRWVQNLTDPLKGSEIRQKELELDFHAKALKRELSGSNLRLKFLEIISELGLGITDTLSKDTQNKQSKQSDTNWGLSISELQNIAQVAIKSDMVNETGRKELFSSIEKTLKGISDGGLKKLSMSIILIVINSTMKSKTFTFAKMQALIELYIVHSMLYYPNCIDEALSNLIEIQRNTSYAKNRRSKGNSANTDNPADTQLSFGAGFGDDPFGSLGKGSGREIFPLQESDGVFNSQGGGEPKSGKRICSTIDSRYGALRNSGETYIEVGTLRTHKDGEGFREVNSNLCPTIPARARAREAGSGQPVIKVQEATIKGYAEAYEGDSINLQQPGSNTRKGRVGVGVANTLDSGCAQAVIPPMKISNTNMSGITYSKDEAGTLRSNASHNYQLVNAIRRLTPIECERLQGFPDDWTKYGKDGELISDTQRYKMCGNAVSVPVVEAVGRASIIAGEGI